MKRRVSLFLLIFCLAAGCLTAGIPASARQGEALFFVATDGSDENSGTLEAPFATLEAARDAVRKAGKPAVVCLREGVYHFDDSFVLSEQDHDTVYRSYNGEKVIFTAAATITGDQFQKVTDQAVLNRIVDTNARDHIYTVNLKEQGFDDLGKLLPAGFNPGGEGYAVNAAYPSLLVNGVAQTIARYPNAGQEELSVSELVTGGYDLGLLTTEEQMKLDGNVSVEEWDHETYPCFQLRTKDSRLSQWKEAQDIWAMGFWRYEWAETFLPVEIDFDNQNLVKAKYGTAYGTTTAARFYFYNLLEEIDTAGEWYLDHQTGDLYYYPEKPLTKADTVEYITGTKPFVELKGSRNITFYEISMEKNLGKGIQADNVDGLTVAGCGFNHLYDTVIKGEQVTNAYIADNTVQDIGAYGIVISGGDVTTLTPSGNQVINNKITNFSMVKRTFAPGISIGGVGALVSHNQLSESPNVALQYGGNDHVFEYNEIFNVCNDSSDAGATYTACSYSNRGNVMRYNYFHDLRQNRNETSMRVVAVYLDDMHCSTSVYGNVIYNCEYAALYGGGRNNTFQNNLLIDSGEFKMDARGNWPGDDWERKKEKMRNALAALPYQEGIWAEKYPELVNLMEDDPEQPKYNVISNNVSYHTPEFDLAGEVKQYSTVENNITISSPKNFVDYKNKDFTLAQDSEVFTKLPDFEPVPFDEMGLSDQRQFVLEDVVPREADQILQSGIVLVTDCPKAYCKGQKTMIDPDNANVKPIVRNDRTFVPVRFIAEGFGAEVGWNEERQEVSIRLDGKEILLVIGAKELSVDRKVTQLDVAPLVLEDRTLVPLRAVAEAFGMEVGWYDHSQGGLITISDQPVITSETTDETVQEVIDRVKQ